MDIISVVAYQGTGQIAGLLNTYLHQINLKREQKYEVKMKELEIISNSAMKDFYAQQLILDKFLYPIKKVNVRLQDMAKSAQYLAEFICYYHGDHNATLDEAKEIAQEARQLAIKLTKADSLEELKNLYEALTMFTHEISKFRHHDRKYSIERHIRKQILNPLNSVIGDAKNFQLRATFTLANEQVQPPLGLQENYPNIFSEKD